uniref:Ectonucleotide pyrophosphatase/phosphodiesterase family member 1-like n=1 Tax=Gouania willdenowi TaxID=441366 RepID=A0A8C5H466_GOUWI
MQVAQEDLCLKKTLCVFSTLRTLALKDLIWPPGLEFDVFYSVTYFHHIFEAISSLSASLKELLCISLAWSYYSTHYKKTQLLMNISVSHLCLFLRSFSKSPLILVSLDGFRSEYLKDHISHMPIIDKLRNNGTTAPYMRPVYPTKTFPNHYSIVTGLYPESHGIVDNKMYDPTRNTFFSLKTEEKFNPKWYQGEPIWITAMHQKLKTGTFFWPGSDVTRVLTILEWLDLPKDKRPDFYTLYLDEPDSSGHRYGPGSSQVIQALENVNNMMGMLMDGLARRDLHRCCNIIIVSDHGEKDTRQWRAPKCRTPDQAMRPYLKENLPKRFHFANNLLIERGHLYMKSGWQAEMKYCTGGFHGSDNTFTNMQAIFIGYGPGLKENTVVEPFENIELYNLMCDLLGIRPVPNNGTHGSLNHLLKFPVHLPVHPAQLAHDTACETTNLIPTDNRQCTCTSQTTAMVGVNQDKLKEGVCVRADVRVPLADSQLCARYRDDPALSYGLLHPPNLNATSPQSDSLITSNMAPMFPAFKDVWLHIHNVLLPKYSHQLNGVNVMSGPVFDADFDGNVDALRRVSGNEAPVPTHFFMILTNCKNSTHGPVNCNGPLQASSFILPHRPDHTESCSDGSDFKWVEDWLSFHAARVRDIELLTGLSFYHDRLSVEETLQLKTFLKTA